MIRDAKFADVMALTALLCEAHARSKYAGLGNVDMAEAKRLLCASIQRHGGQHDGATLVLVAEDADKRLCGLFLGMLQRVYHIGDILEATDVFFYLAEGADPRDAKRMLDTFTAWAEGAPKVVTIRHGVTDIMGDHERTERLFRRRGMARSGVIYERRVER